MAKKKPAAKKWTCVLCGRRIYNFETGNVIGSTGRMVCKECLKISERLLRTKEQTTSLKEKKEEYVLSRSSMDASRHSLARR